MGRYLGEVVAILLFGLWAIWTKSRRGMLRSFVINSCPSHLLRVMITGFDALDVILNGHTFNGLLISNFQRDSPAKLF